MSNIGQVLNVLQNLETGLESTGMQEQQSRKAEAKTHRDIFQKLRGGMLKAGKAGKKKQSLPFWLTTAASLAGAGIPALLAIQLASSYMANKAGAKASKAEIDKLGGMAGTKFGDEATAYKAGVEKNILKDALWDTGKLALTMGLSKGAGSLLAPLGKGADKIKDLGKFLEGKNVNEGLSGFFKGLGQKTVGGVKKPNILGKIISGPKGEGGIKKLLEGLQITADDIARETAGFEVPKNINIAGKEIKIPEGLFTQKGSTKFLDKGMQETLANIGVQELTRKQQPSRFDYELPQSLSIPSAYGRYS